MTASLYGLLAEFDAPAELVAASRRARAAGYRDIDAFTPFPVEGLSDAIGFKKTRLPLLVLLGGVAGGVSGYLMQYCIAVISYPLNIGGRPLNSWPAFIPVTFECAILAAALAAVLGMFFLNGLPRLHHPVFNAARFDRASRDKFFLCIQATDVRFDPALSRRFLFELGAKAVEDVTDE